LGRESVEADAANRSVFVQELLLALMSAPTDNVSSERECSWSSVEDLLSDSDGSLSRSVTGNDTDAAAAADLCDEPLSIGVANCLAVDSQKVACWRAGVS